MTPRYLVCRVEEREPHADDREVLRADRVTDGETDYVAYFVIRLTKEPPDPLDERLGGFGRVLEGDTPAETFDRMLCDMSTRRPGSDYMAAVRKVLGE